MKKTDGTVTDDLRPEYDFASMKGGVRGKYAKRFREGTNIVLIDPEMTEAFPTEAAVNEALRGVLNTVRAVRNGGGLPNKALQPTSRAKRSSEGERGPARLAAERRTLDRPNGRQNTVADVVIGFSVGDGQRRRAATWRCWAAQGLGRNDVYLAYRELRGALKAL